MLEGPLAFDSEGVDHCLLERQGYVAASLLGVVARRLTLLPGIQGKGLQAAEAELQPRAVSHWPRKFEAPRRTAQRQTGNLRTTGILQPHQLGGLVECLARRIIQRLAEQLVLTDAIDPNQLGMPARHQQSDERKSRRLFFQHRRQQMAFHMVHTERRNIPGERQCLGTGRSHEERTDQAGAGGVGDGVDVNRNATGFAQHLTDQRQHSLDVIARSQLRHYAAIYTVQINLASASRPRSLS